MDQSELFSEIKHVLLEPLDLETTVKKVLALARLYHRAENEFSSEFLAFSDSFDVPGGPDEKITIVRGRTKDKTEQIKIFTQVNGRKAYRPVEMLPGYDYSIRINVNERGTPSKEVEAEDVEEEAVDPCPICEGKMIDHGTYARCEFCDYEEAY